MKGIAFHFHCYFRDWIEESKKQKMWPEVLEVTG